MSAAIAVEWRKFRRSLTVRLTTAALVAGVVAGAVVMVAAPGPAGSAIDAKAQLFGGEGGWAGLTTVAAVVMSAGGLLGFGIAAAWLFAREFTDGAMPGLFALPTSRLAIAGAKLLVFAAWIVVTSLLLLAVMTAAGLLLGFGVPAGQAGEGLVRLLIVSLLTGALALPAAWVASLARGFLAPVGLVIGLIAAAQVAMYTPIGAWFPVAAPGAWAGLAGTAASATPVQLALVLPFGAAFAALTLLAWHRLRFD